MNQRHQTTTKLAQTAIFAALCYVAFAFLQIKIPVPGGDATSIHAGNAFCALAALILGGGYGGLAGAVGMTIGDLLDPIYIVGAPKTFVLKFRPPGSDLYCRSTEDIRAEIHDWSDCRACCAQNRKDQ